MSELNKEDIQSKEEQNDVFDSSKTKFKPISEEILGKSMVKEIDAEVVSEEDLESILNSKHLLNKNNKLNLSYFDKDTRQLIKERIEQEHLKLIAVFEALLEKPDVTKDELIRGIQIERDSIITRHPYMNIKFTQDGSIDLRTVVKRFRLKYRELEERRRAKFQKKVLGILSDNHRISLAVAADIREQGKAMKKPYKGKFQ